MRSNLGNVDLFICLFADEPLFFWPHWPKLQPMKPIPNSELIIKADGSIYHLNLRPENIADTIITVGDPERVGKVSRHFDEIEFKTAKREFVTHTGRIGKKRLTVISSGIGTDNIDIVINEIDALANIDFKTRLPNENPKVLNFIRIGTSGCLQKDIPVESIVVSAFAIGLDNLMHYYPYQNTLQEAQLYDELDSFLNHVGRLPVVPYVFSSSKELLETIGKGLIKGITLTSPGFYAPQGRALRGKTKLLPDYLEKLSHFEFENCKMTNFEMETSGIYGLSRLLGHRALSCNVILANRMAKTFSPDPKALEEKLIIEILGRIA